MVAACWGMSGKCHRVSVKLILHSLSEFCCHLARCVAMSPTKPRALVPSSVKQEAGRWSPRLLPVLIGFDPSSRNKILRHENDTYFGVYLPQDPVPSGFSAGEVLIPLADEYDPMFPNDYEKVVKRQREERQRQRELERQKEIEEREK